MNLKYFAKYQPEDYVRMSPSWQYSLPGIWKVTKVRLGHELAPLDLEDESSKPHIVCELLSDSGTGCIVWEGHLTPADGPTSASAIAGLLK